MRFSDYRRVMTMAVAGGLVAGGAGEAVGVPTLEAKLEAIKVDATLFDVQVWARTNNTSEAFPVGDGGIKAFGFSVLTVGTGLAAPVQAAVTGPNATRVRTEWDPVISQNFAVFSPVYRDAPINQYPADIDLDVDAMGGAFVDFNTFVKTDLGINNTWQLVATERWQLTTEGAGPGEQLTLLVDNPLYYDLTAPNAGKQVDFAEIRTWGVSLPGSGTTLPPIIGDVNGDRVVGLGDVNVVIANWLAIGVPRSQGDANLDGVVNQLDINLITGNWLATDAPAAAALAVPEPGAAALGVGLLAMAAGRRWRPRRQRRAGALVGAAAVVLGALVPPTSSEASTIEAKLVAIKTAPSLFDVQVWARTDNLSSAFPGGDGGIAGFQFDVTSDGTGWSVPVADPMNGGRVQTSFPAAISSAFGTITPRRMDGVPALGHVTDGDVDGLGGSIYDAGGYQNTTMGLDGVYSLVATQQWRLTTGFGGGQYTGDRLSLRLVGPTYYDYSNQTPGSINRQYFTTSVTQGVSLEPDPRPEPVPALRAYLTYRLTSPTTAEVDVYARVTGMDAADGGGIASLGFDILSTDGNARPLVAAGGDGTRAMMVWDPLVAASGYNLIDPRLADANDVLISSAANAVHARQARGAAIFDSGGVSNIGFGLDQFVHIGTQQWELLGGGSVFELALTVAGAAAFDVGNVAGGGRTTISEISATGVVIGAFIPEPGVIGLVAVLPVFLAGDRRRRAA